MTKGQLLSQSGIEGSASGQQVMSTAIPAISPIWTEAFIDMSAIAYSAAIVLTGAISTPTRADSDKTRITAERYFIELMLGMGQAQ